MSIEFLYLIRTRTQSWVHHGREWAPSDSSSVPILWHLCALISCSQTYSGACDLEAVSELLWMEWASLLVSLQTGALAGFRRGREKSSHRATSVPVVLCCVSGGVTLRCRFPDSSVLNWGTASRVAGRIPWTGSVIPCPSSSLPYQIRLWSSHFSSGSGHFFWVPAAELRWGKKRGKEQHQLAAF